MLFFSNSVYDATKLHRHFLLCGLRSVLYRGSCSVVPNQQVDAIGALIIGQMFRR